MAAPQRSTRSKSYTSRPDLRTAKSTAPGPPLSARDTSAVLDAVHLSNPFHVDLVVPYSIALGKGDRSVEQQEIRDGYETLLRDLESVGGLRLASRVPKGKKGEEEVWLFIGISEEKLQELVEMERCVFTTGSWVQLTAGFWTRPTTSRPTAESNRPHPALVFVCCTMHLCTLLSSMGSESLPVKDSGSGSKGLSPCTTKSRTKRGSRNGPWEVIGELACSKVWAIERDQVSASM